MRCIEIIEQPYCQGCPMSDFKIVGVSAVCEHAEMCDRLYHWLKDGKKYLRPAVETVDEEEDEEEKLYRWDDSEYSFSDDVKYEDIKDLI